MVKTRVLIVDDSVVIRRLLTDVVAGDPSLEVAGVAANGRIALAKLPQVSPDVVILDIEMPEMDGLQALAELRRSYPRLPVIMFSTLTECGAAHTLEALALGASDYITKPAGVGSLGAATERVREELLPLIKALHRPSSPPEQVSLGGVAIAPPPMDPETRSVSALAIGVSTGGPNALASLLPQLPADFPVPVLVVQHMPPLFTKLLADRLDGQCPLAVREAMPGATVEPGTIWLAPGDWHVAVQRTATGVVLRTHQAPQENSCRPSVDVLFRSVAAAYGSGALAVVLTGMGQDGLRGSEAIREGGGRVLAQDEASSVVWGMPGFVAKAGLADRVLSLDQLALEIIRGTTRAESPGKVA